MLIATAMVMHTKLRAPVSGRVLASDATTKVAAGVVAVVDPEIVRDKLRFAQMKGVHVRLDKDRQFPSAHLMRMALDFDVYQHSWDTQYIHQFKWEEHINVLELRAELMLLMKECNSGYLFGQ